MSVDVGVQLKMHNSDFLRGVASSKIGMAALKKEWESFGRQVNASNKVMKDAERELEKLNQRASRMTHTTRALSLNFYELRNAIRNLATRAAITGFASVAAAITSLATTATAAVTSVTNLTGALAIGAGGGLVAGFQGIAVAALGLDKVMKALTTTGKDHEKALAKLTPQAKTFAGALAPLRDLYREIQLLSQAGLFPGLTSALKRLQPMFEMFKQVVYDTAVNMGYLADRGAAMFASRAGLIKKILENNTKLLQTYGRSVENFGAGLVEVWVAAIPLMDHVAKKVLHFSDNFKDAMRDWRKDGSLGAFFDNFKESFDNWTDILKGFGETLYNVFMASQPVAHELERDTAKLFQKFADWTGKNGPKMEEYFKKMYKPFKAFANLVGDTVAMVFRLGDLGADSTTKFFNAIDSKLLPVVEELVTTLHKDFVQSVGNMLGSMLDFIRVAMPGLEGLLKPLGLIAEGFATIVRTMTQFVSWGNSHFGKLGGMVTTALSVAAITGAWIALRVQIQAVLGLLGRGTGVVKSVAKMPTNYLIGTPQRSGAIVRGARATGRYVTEPVLGGYRADKRMQAAYDAERRANPQGFHAISLGTGPNVRNLQLAQQGLQTLPNGETFVGYPSTGRGMRPPTRTPLVGERPTFTFLGGQRELAMRDRIRLARMQPPRPLEEMRTVSMTNPNPDIYGTIPGYTRTRSRLRSGVSMKRGIPGYTQPPLERMPRSANVLKGGEGAALFKNYRDQMKESTKSGFLSGLKGMFSSGKGSAALGTLGMLTGNIALALAVPIGIAAIGALSKAFKDKRPQVVQDIEKIPAINAPPIMTGKGSGGAAAAQRTQLMKEGPFGQIASKLNLAIKNKDVDGIRRARTELEKLGDTMKDIDKKNAITKLGKDLGTLSSQVSTALLGTVNKDFETFATTSQNSIDDTMDALSVLKVQITAKMPVAGREYKEAMAAAFGQAADAIQTEIDNGLVKSKQGLREIHKLLMAQYKQLGFTPEEAKHLADPKNKTKDPAGNQGREGGASRAMARGGYIGGKGQVGRDSVPMNIGGQPVITAPGEYVGIFTRHQQRFIEQSTGMPMDKIFSTHQTPHYASKGAIYDLGERIQKMSYAGAPYSVSENSHFGGVHPVHAKNSYHYKDEALDINHDIPTGSEKGALDKLASMLQSEGWHVLWQVAGHFDHLHVDTASGDGGMVGAIAKLIDPPDVKATSLITGIAQGVVNKATAAANTVLESLGSGSTEFEGSVKGGGNSAENRKLARRMMKQFGWGSNEWDSLDKLGNKESGWNQAAVNPSSGAFGIGQFLGGTKDAYAKYGATSSQPGPQIRAMLQYIKDRYGSPSAAWAFHLAHNWYDTGGTPDPPPTSGNKAPDVDPKDAITPGSVKKKKKRDKKKKTVRIAGNRPTVGAGVGIGSFKPKSKQPKPKPRKIVQRIIKKAFGIKDTNFQDPITGETLGIDTYGPLAYINRLDTGIGGMNDMLDSLSSAAGLTQEEAIVSLFDSEQYPDFTNYLKNVMGKDDAGVQAYIAKYGDTIDVVNPQGMMVQGSYVRGIAQAVQELQAQLAIHTKQPVVHDEQGILGGLMMELATAKKIPSEQAIQERVQRLKQIKKIFEANVELRKKYKKKMNKMVSGNYTWQEAVDHNSDLITAWRRWKRDSIGEPQVDTDQANHEIDRLTDMNKELRRTKPKGRVYSSAEYQQTLTTYQGRGIENRMLVGDKDATKWEPQSAGGYVGKVSNALANWRNIDEQRSAYLQGLPASISTERSNIAALESNIAEWTGTKVAPQPISRSAADTTDDDLRKTIAMDSLRSAILGATQTDVLKNFAQIMGMRLLGAYAHGGLVGETGVALVHKGEYITPAPDGPYNNVAGHNSGNFVTELHFHGNSDQLVKLVDSRVRQVAPGEVSRASGRSTRRISVAPGRR